MTNVVEDRQDEQVYVERAAALRDRFREHAVEAERERHLNDADVEAMTEAGLTSLSVRKEFGGAELSWRTLIDVVRVLGQGDVAAGWVVGIDNASAFLVSLLSEQAQQEVWGDGREHRFAGVLTPSGTATVVEGGIRLSGRWPYMSGVRHADWVMIATSLNGEPLGPTADLGMVLVPRSDLTLEDNWDVIGMSATGSVAAVVEDAFVPEHRMLRYATYNPENYDGIYRTGVFPALSVGLIGAIVGEAEHALEIVLAKAPSRPINTTTYFQQTQSATFQAEVARAAQLIQTARMTLERAGEEMDVITAEQRVWTEEETVRNRADCGYVARACWEAVDMLASAHGTSTFASVNPLSRIWRNVGMAARHAGIAIRVTEELRGRSLLGMDTKQISMTI